MQEMMKFSSYMTPKAMQKMRQQNITMRRMRQPMITILMMGPGANHDIPLHQWTCLLYNTLKDALQSIRGFTKEYGYALTKLRSKKGKGWRG